MRAQQILITSLAAFVLAACSESPTDVEMPTFDEPLSVTWLARAGLLITAGSLSPIAAGRVYAALSVAQYDAVMAANELNSGGILEERGAIAGASAGVLSFFFATAAASLEAQAIADGNTMTGGVHPEFARGLVTGRATAEASVERVKADRFTAAWTGTVPVGAGMWVANGPPAGAMLGEAKPYFMTSGSQFRPAPPPAYSSTDFNAALAEVQTYAQNRTAAQIASAVQWNSVPASLYWNEVAARYVEDNRLDETDAAHVLGLMHAAVFDALIACWDAKYYYWLLRPSQAEPAITLALGLPNHPSYPSGHSCVSAAAGTVLTHFFPSHASEISALVAEAGLSRILGGLHYRFDIVAGNTLGHAVAQFALGRDF